MKKIAFPGLRKLLLSPRPDAGSDGTEAVRARALFQPPDRGMTDANRDLAVFLKQVALFENLDRRELAQVARVVHERDYTDGEWISEEGKPAAALFIVRRGVVEVVRRGAAGGQVPLALLEPPATFEESAALATGVMRWFSVRAHGPASLLALGKTDLDALSAHYPTLANKVLRKVASIMAMRFKVLIDAEIVPESGNHEEGKA